MGRSSRSATTQAQQDTDIESDLKTVNTWDGTPLGKPAFYTSGRRLVLDQVEGARLYAQFFGAAQRM